MEIHSFLYFLEFRYFLHVTGGRTAQIIYTATLTVLFLVISTYIYTHIFHASTKTCHGNHITSNPDQQAEGSPSSAKLKKQFAKEIKIAKSCFLIMSCPCLCYLPLQIINIIHVQQNWTLYQAMGFRVWALTAVSLNSLLNSLIFFRRNRLLRIEAQKVLKWN